VPIIHLNSEDLKVINMLIRFHLALSDNIYARKCSTKLQDKLFKVKKQRKLINYNWKPGNITDMRPARRIG